MSSDSSFDHADSWDAEITEYKALSAMAILGLLLGLISPAWIFDPLTWVVPVPLFAAAFSGAALWRIARNAPALIGRKAALAGLFLSLLTCAATPTNWLTYRQHIRSEARLCASQWFTLLCNNEPCKAHQLTVAPDVRLPLDDDIRGYYAALERPRTQLESFLDDRVPHVLLTLGDRAQARFYQIVDQTHRSTDDSVRMLYAVTFDDAGERKTFFVHLNLKRLAGEDGRINWQVTLAEGARIPAALRAADEETP